jgi:predicted ATPase
MKERIVEPMEDQCEEKSCYPVSTVGGAIGSSIAIPKISTRDEAPKTESHKMWAKQGDNYMSCESAVDTLPADQYVPRMSDHGLFFARTTTTTDGLLALPDSASQEVVDAMDLFWNSEDKFRAMDMLWKRGIMLWGPPGSGKTTCIHTIVRKVVDERDGVALFVENPQVCAMALAELRKIEPTRNVVVLLEDVDAIISSYGETTLLALLDGELQVDNVVFIATTNYPERLDKRFINRPSRFDLVKFIDMPSPEARKVYITHKYGDKITPEEIDEWVEKTDKFSIAHLKELIISVECFGNTVEETIERLKKMITEEICSDDYHHTKSSGKSGFGFTSTGLCAS